MTSLSTYPVSLDTNQNLYQVHDALRVQLIEDYNPGDTSITVLGDPTTMLLFGQNGIITLTDQCNEPNERGISFSYGLVTPTTFEQLVLLPGFTDVVKPAYLTSVTQNVMAFHHNALKDALIAIEEFAGRQGELPIQPLVGTMEQRVTYIRNLALAPKAWFSVNETIGLAPLTVIFTSQSFRLGTDGTSQEVEQVWDFGDNTGPSIITINESEEVPVGLINVLVNDTGNGVITKTYTKPGVYTVTLTVTNDFGTDTVVFTDLISARFPAPDTAVIDFIQNAGQIVTEGIPSGGPYTSPPTIRAPINSIINVIINPGINSNTGETYGGETVDGSGSPIDPIIDYTWSFSDDLNHNNATTAIAVFSVGGLYDLTLRVDTEFGAYRITSYSDSFDIVESVNLWLWNYTSDGGSVFSYEFGLISETFKSASSAMLALNVNDQFLTNQVNSAQQIREFNRNVGFAQLGSNPSGNGGSGVLYWASGRSSLQSPSVETINMSEFNGFEETYVTLPNHLRPWNWVSFASTQTLYFILGGITGSIAPYTSPTNQILDSMTLNSFIYNSSPPTLTAANYFNGADDLLNNQVSYDGSGNSQQGNMSVYRSTWYSDTGYFLRNQGVGTFFRIMSFYGTNGNTAEPFQNIWGLPPLNGPARTEGQLVSLSQGVYFFNNSGAVSAYNPVSGIWQVGGPGNNSAAFNSLQDTSVVGFADTSQTLLASSDGLSVVYLSFDYSANAFIKFNSVDNTFSSVTARPVGNQWYMNIS